jgi:hypothetical protein
VIDDGCNDLKYGFKEGFGIIYTQSDGQSGGYTYAQQSLVE